MTYKEAAEAYEAYITSPSKPVKRGTVASYRKHLNPTKIFFGDELMEDIDAQRVRDYLDHLSAEGKAKKTAQLGSFGRGTKQHLPRGADVNFSDGVLAALGGQVEGVHRVDLVAPKFHMEQQQHCLLKKSPDLPHSLPASVPGIRTAND